MVQEKKKENSKHRRRFGIHQLAPRSPKKSQYQEAYNYGATKEKEAKKLEAIENKIATSIKSFEIFVEEKLTNQMEKKMEEKIQNLKNELEISCIKMIQKKFNALTKDLKKQIENISDERIPDLNKLEKDITGTISKKIVSNFVTKLPLFMAEKLAPVEMKNQMTQTMTKEEKTEKYFVNKKIQTENSQFEEKDICSQECQSEISHVIEIKEELSKLKKKEKLKIKLQKKKNEPLPSYQMEAILRIRDRNSKQKLLNQKVKKAKIISNSPLPDKYVKYSQKKTAEIVKRWMPRKLVLH